MKQSILRHILLAATVLCVIWCSTGCGAAVEAIRQLRGEKPGSNDPVTETEQLKPPQDIQSAKTDGESEQEQESPETETNSEWDFEQTQVPQLELSSRGTGGTGKRGAPASNPCSRSIHFRGPGKYPLSIQLMNGISA